MHIIHKLHDAPIKIKMMAIYLLVNIMAMTLSFVFMMSDEFYSIRHAVVINMHAQASIMAQNVAEGTASQHAVSINQSLKTLDIVPIISQAQVSLLDGTTIAQYQKPTIKENALIELLNKTDWNTFTIQQDIIWQDKKVGSIRIFSRLNQLYHHLLLFVAISLFAGLFALYSAYLMSRYWSERITKPLTALNGLMDTITQSQNFSLRSDLQSADEVGELSKGINTMLDLIEKRNGELAHELIQRGLVEAKLDQLAHQDNVTHLPNRHFFNQYLQKSISAAQEQNTILCVMFVDLDNFKIVNDTLGHLAGDTLLNEVAHRIQVALKHEDVVCRIGGDEFAIVKCNIVSPDIADRVARNVIESLNKPFNIQNNEIYVGASIGMSFFPEDAKEISSLLSSADAAMYHAKALGKNNFQHYHTDMEGKIRRRLNMENSLRRALEADEMELYYQPQVNIHTLRIQGFEALLRWNHPKMGIITPNEFIHYAEDASLILPLGEWVMQTACYQAKVWQATYDENLHMSVNFTARQLRDDDMVEKILSALLIADMPPHTLDIELTESSLMDNSELSVDKMRQLRSAGIHISIDDFGTGFSSLSYLKRFPLSALKIDRSFINDIPFDEDDVAITNAIIALATTLKIDVIAEGVETQAQLDYLRANCTGQAQGYLLCPALPANRMEEFLSNLKTPLTIAL